MPVGKAAAAEPGATTHDFRFVVPCLTRIDEVRIREHLADHRFFWLDLTAPDHDDLGALQRLFGFHPLAIEDVEHGGQRPKLDNYVDHIFLVFYGAWRDRPEIE